jgi:hypothetical protein
MFGRLKNFWSALRRTSEVPADFARIIDGLPEGWQLVSFKWTFEDDWAAELRYEERRFKVESDYGYPWTAIELIEVEPPILSSPLNSRWSASGNPEHIHAALAQIAPLRK